MVKPLDREANETLRMRVLAEDQGEPKRTDQSEVEFVLTDVNDNAPVIRPQKSVASVFEVNETHGPINNSLSSLNGLTNKTRIEKKIDKKVRK